MIAELYFDHEMRERDIAEYLGVTESRVSQLLRPIQREIAAGAVLEERLAEYKDDPGASLLAVKWIAV